MLQLIYLLKGENNTLVLFCNNMKIGLISINMYSKYLNFACPLHTFAFQQFLTYLGIDSTVINYKPIYFNNFDMEHPYDYYRINGRSTKSFN